MLKSVMLLMPACALFVGSAVQLSKDRTLLASLQLIGAGGWVIVALSHVCEHFNLLSWMLWGHPNSAGHYLDLLGASFGLILFPIGYLLQALMRPGLARREER